MLTLQAAAISDAIVLPTERMIGQVKAIHNDYVNILTSDGIIALVRAGMPHIPFGIEAEIRGGWLTAGWMGNQPVFCHSDAIIIGDCMAITGLRHCQRFSCQPSYRSEAGDVNFLTRLQHLQRCCNDRGEAGGIITYLGRYDAELFCMGRESLGLFEARIPQHVKTLVSGVLHNNEGLMIEGICGLLGVGPGSTPSGDDFLLGFLSGMIHTQHRDFREASEKIGYHMVENAKNLTTFLSIEYIKYGVRGLYHQRFSELISAFAAGTEEEMVRRAKGLMALGHTSGTDLLVGFIYGGFTALAADITVDRKGERNEHL